MLRSLAVFALATWVVGCKSCNEPVGPPPPTPIVPRTVRDAGAAAAPVIAADAGAPPAAEPGADAGEAAAAEADGGTIAIALADFTPTCPRDGGCGPTAITYQPRQEAWPEQEWSFHTVEHPPPECEEGGGSEELCGLTFKRLAQFFTVGKFTSGPYAGADLILEVQAVEEDGPGKGTSYVLQRRRYAREEGRLVLFPKISQLGWDPKGAVEQRLARRGLKLVTDKTFDLPALAVPKELHGPKPRQVLVLTTATDAPPSDEKAVAFEDPGLGPVHTTDEPSLKFWVDEPDGTKLKFEQQVLPIAWTVTWKNGTTSTGALYRYRSSDELPEVLYYPYDTFADDVKPEALEPIGKAADGAEVLGYKDPKDPALTALYETYKAQLGGRSGAGEPIEYDAFLSHRPIIFERDGFGRLLRLTAVQFLAVAAVEPVIYLYPPAPERVSVRVGAPVRLGRTLPAHGEGWQVDARPDGRLRAGGHRYRYLFWEGALPPTPLPTQGFVAKREDLPALWHRVLPKLGLDARETDDFVAAWAPRLTEARWYLISFVPRARIDAAAPLEVTPPPDTMIRVLMDVVPLARPIAVPPQALPAPPARKGFTLVEWGGLER